MSTEYEAGYNSPHIPCNHGDAQAIEYARLVAENAMPVEDEAEVLAAEMQEAMNEKSLIGCVQIAVKYGDKRTAALQAELDRANDLLDRIAGFVNDPMIPDWQIVNNINGALQDCCNPPPDTPRPAVVITDESFLEKLRRVNHERWIAWAGHDEADPLYAANEFGGEAGEVLNVVKKLVRASRGWKGSRTTVPKLADEIADCIICLDSLARMYDIDIASAVVSKFNATSDANGFPHKLEGSSS